MKNEEIHTTKAFVNTWYLLGSVLTSWTSPSTNFLWKHVRMEPIIQYIIRYVSYVFVINALDPA